VPPSGASSALAGLNFFGAAFVATPQGRRGIARFATKTAVWIPVFSTVGSELVIVPKSMWSRSVRTDQLCANMYSAASPATHPDLVSLLVEDAKSVAVEEAPHPKTRQLSVSAVFTWPAQRMAPRNDQARCCPATTHRPANGNGVSRRRNRKRGKYGERGGLRRMSSTGVFRVVPHAPRRSGPRHAVVLRIGSTRAAAIPAHGGQALLKR
jgi:hypothetical protein